MWYDDAVRGTPGSVPLPPNQTFKETLNEDIYSSCAGDYGCSRYPERFIGAEGLAFSADLLARLPGNGGPGDPAAGGAGLAFSADLLARLPGNGCPGDPTAGSAGLALSADLLARLPHIGPGAKLGQCRSRFK